MHKTIYDKNSTMLLLGQQKYTDIADEALGEIEAVIKAHAPNIDIAPHNVRAHMVETSWDLFILGFIYGKRAERARRAKKTTQTA